MKLGKKEIKELIAALGFKVQSGSKDVFYKNYPKNNNYVLKVDFEHEKIEYGLSIKLGDLTTSHFANSENFVVLECVDRVLEKGYDPDKISLEHKWLMGRREKGKLDILINDKNDKAYLMIECKTWCEEYEKEKKKMQLDGGQLFSYFQQDKSAQYLCLYASRFNKGRIEYINDIVKVDEQWKELSNQKEIFDHWNKNFKDNGIFNEWANAYDIEIKALTRGRLKELTEDDSGRIFNQFAEILRHNVVSDKPNAFNKIFNLFLCKIVDEDRKPDEELKFQWLEIDTDEELQKRLSDLYKQGMKEYLTKEVTDYNDEQIAEKLYALDSEIREQIREMFTRVRLHKNNEFAFKEVFDEKSFKENAIVVREVVELLQPFQIRYGHKQQFLGDFFELLLSTGIKQEAGQFFTPVPIAKFIVSSLPIRELIEKKISNDETNFLPYVIDYAAGSGHFLTEVMDEIQKIIENIDPNKQRPSVKAKLKSWRESAFDWAYDYVYGIEADYRLVKTAKVSCFLNGDGLANVIHADGLDHFEKSIEYISKLKEVSQDDSKDNGQFDILVANPPYSVSAFKNTLRFGEESFELFNRLTDDSSEIECLFIERAKQLLKEGGMAGIILPSTMLSNPGIYRDAREILLKYFKINAIAKFGNNTFMATGTPTIAVFLERRNNNEWKKISGQINNFFDDPEKNLSNHFIEIVTAYIETVFDGISLADYKSWIQKKPNLVVTSQEIFQDYKSWFNNLSETKKIKVSQEKEFAKLESELIKKIKSENESIPQKELEKISQEKLPIIQEELREKHNTALLKEFYEKSIILEKEKILFFFLSYSQDLVLVDVGDKQEEKDFIGYEFSARRGHEGIKMYRNETGELTTSLYDEQGLSEKKVNLYIYNQFIQQEKDIDPTLSNNVSHVDLISLMKFSQLDFDKSINLSSVVNPFKHSQHPIVRVKDLLELQYGKPLSKNKRENGSCPVMGSNGITGYHNKYLIEAPAVIVGRKGSAGKVTFVEDNCFPIDTTFYVKNKSSYPIKYLYYLLLVLPLKDLSKSMGVPGLNRNDVHNLRVPKPEPEIVTQKVKYLDEVFEKRTECYAPKKNASDNESEFMEYFKTEIIKAFL
jgi:type I restriction enzyme M protein